jgi:hypothetical protein
MGLLDWLFGSLDDKRMSCHCYKVEVGYDSLGHEEAGIVMPEKHADWCPAGMTMREFREQYPVKR